MFCRITTVCISLPAISPEVSNAVHFYRMSAQDSISYATEGERDSETEEENRDTHDVKGKGGTEEVVRKEGTVGEKGGVGAEEVRGGGITQKVMGRKSSIF